MKIDLLIIDPQNDFCLENGSLSVGGAKDDMQRLATMIDRIGSKLNDIHVTLDSHHVVDIAHPIFWVNSKGEHPGEKDYTIISASDVINGVWRPKNPAYLNKDTMAASGWPRDGVMEYITTLQDNGRYPLCIWPFHCLIGSVGAAVVIPLYDTLVDWEEANFAMVDYVTKGSNFLTEHYSAVQADVPDPQDPDTLLNESLIRILEAADEILLAGEARSHCLANTVRDIANNFGEDNIKKMVLLEDATSDVATFEQMGEDFVKEMKGRGMRISNTVDYLK
jgi:nicotinamidase-related amidase